jgi:branched-chain amino acid transport system substrate-binding protein
MSEIIRRRPESSCVRTWPLLLGIVGAVLAAGIVLAACGNDDQSSGSGAGADAKTLRIGFSGTGSGPWAAYDAPILAGMEFAADEINKSGDLQVEIDFRDNGQDQAVAATDVQAMLDEGITTFVLTAAPPAVAEGLQVSDAGGVSALGAGTLPSDLQEIGDRAFLFAFGDNVQSAAIAQYACNQGYRRVFSLSSSEYPYTLKNPEYFEDAFAHFCDGRVVETAEFKLEANDYSTQVSKVKSAAGEIDAVFSPMFVPDSGVFLKQLRGAGVDTPYLGLDGNDTPLYAKGGGSAVGGSVYSTHAFAQDGNAAAKFNAKFEAATGEPPESVFEALGRDTVYIYADAIKRAGSTDPDAVIEALEQTKDLELVTGGRMTMNPETHIPEKEVAIVRLDGTTPRLVESFVPEYIPSP